MSTRINESKQLTKHLFCKCKRKLMAENLTQQNNNKC